MGPNVGRHHVCRLDTLQVMAPTGPCSCVNGKCLLGLLVTAVVPVVLLVMTVVLVLVVLPVSVLWYPIGMEGCRANGPPLSSPKIRLGGPSRDSGISIIKP